ncbi:Crp/Fnr family transcriptional regulator [Flintibacter muris]|uniref:Crp/Fnr family transcriptional regulator n=1 Tax=Flintibacter muris TaxID=2941327 RepID=UPI00203B3103|nr:Crp/Fnr family transcriptional regulator [Flintibacter muris]
MPLTKEETALLSACPLFQGVEEDFLCRLAKMAGREEFLPGQTVYSPQSFQRRLGVVLSGQLQVTKGALAVSVLGPGDLFGAAALYSDEPEFAATIAARCFSRCLMLDQPLVDRLLAEHSQIRENYLRYLTGRVRFLSGRLQTLAQPGVEGKLARYLLSGGGTVTCPATQLCQRLGVSRASLYRAFSALEDSGLILRKGKTITVVDPAGLETVL